jgi:hypothetical protein
MSAVKDKFRVYAVFDRPASDGKALRLALSGGA